MTPFLIVYQRYHRFLGPSSEISPALWGAVRTRTATFLNSDTGQQERCQTRPEAGDLRQVYAEQGVKRGAYVKGQGIRMFCGVTGWRQFTCDRYRFSAPGG